MSETATVRLTRDGDLFLLRMADGENRFNPELLRGISAALDEVEACSDDVALVLTGTGKFYSTGFDAELLGGPGAADLVDASVALCARLLRFGVPTVAAVNGHAFGIGAMIALSQDFRVARADRGYWGFPELPLGYPMHPGMYGLLKLRIAPTPLQELLLSGRRVPGQELLGLGLADEVSDETTLLDCASRRADNLRGRNRGLYAHVKRELNRECLALMEGETDYRFSPVPVHPALK